jgi:hypothetical protein
MRICRFLATLAAVCTIGIAGCGPTSSPVASVSAGNCWSLPGDGRVHSLAWSPDGRDIWVLHGPVTSPRKLSRIAIEPHADKVQTYDLQGDATGPLAVDDADDPVWLAVSPEGEASLRSLVSARQVVLGGLPHPRFLRFYWGSNAAGTAGALVALETDTGDRFRLVRIEASAESSISPFTPAEEVLTDAVVSPDGATIVTARPGRNGSSDLEYSSKALKRHISVENAVSRLDVWAAGARVVFVAGSAVVTSWNVDSGEVSSVTANDVYAHALSSKGNLALARFTKDGPSLTVCVQAL